MNSDQVRTAYFKFFEGKGHKAIPSSSLIPVGDPTLLLTTAGVVQIKPYYMGQEIPPSKRLVSCQKCFRTTDIELVGDATHLTFFEMLGNFSVGDYFKKETIEWGWEFVTGVLKLPADRLWITIFRDDDEAYGYWRDIGIPEDRILRLGEEDNFWGPAGESGPCGPCSEIIYDLGEEYGCKKPDCGPNCDCGRYSEIWNLVFTQYNQDKDGNRTLLPKPNIDTGMGLERTTAVMQDKASVYETDLFTPLIERISGLVGKKYGENEETDNAMRVIADHSRGISFLIADGVLPGNAGRGYVLRRLLRRAALFGRRLGLNKPFLTETAGTTIKQMGNTYPELRRRKSWILEVVGLEEERFSEMLSIGLELLDDLINKALAKGKRKITGKEAFKLSDTYGFPVELTGEVAAERGFAVDLSGFEKEMGKQRERARTAQSFNGESTDNIIGKEQIGVDKTSFTGYDDTRIESKVLGAVIGNNFSNAVSEGQEAGLILESTPFYGEMGGQVGDTGEIKGANGHFTVTDTRRIPPDIVVHRGKVTQGSFSAGDTVKAEVDKERRLDIARNHTATHLLQAALREALGEHIQQRGSLVTPELLRFDFSHLAALTDDQIKNINRIVNERIRQNHIVSGKEVPYKEAIEAGAIALFDEKYGDVVRVLKVGEPPISVELCGGTHLNATGEIGFFHITGESSIGAGLRRIEAVTGRGSELLFEKYLSDLEETANIAGTSRENVVEKVSGIIGDYDVLRKKMQSVERERSKQTAGSLDKKVKEINGIKVLVEKVEPARMDTLREMSDFLKDKIGPAIIVLGALWEGKPAFVANVDPELVKKGFNAGEIVKKVAGIAGGSGGGKATIAQGGGVDKNKIDAALKEVEKMVSKQ